MKTEDRDSAKKLYKELRGLSWPELWGGEVARFNAASPKEREKRVAVIRAAGVVFAESGPPEGREKLREWLLALLHDPCEKVRRYAIAALPKIGAGPEEEAKLLSAMETATGEREKKFLSRTLGKIGGMASLQHGFLGDAEQKVKAGIARKEHPSAVRFNAVLADVAGLRIHLRGRNGLAGLVSQEVEEFQKQHGKFRVAGAQRGRVAIIPSAPFSLADIYSMRCFGTVGFILGRAAGGSEQERTEALAAVITSPLSRRLLEALTEGIVRYRLNFVAEGHQRGAVARLASRVYARCPEILNDARSVTWTIDIFPDAGGHLVELRPNMTPDPRFLYRKRDVPAASHPQLAACMARLAGGDANEVVWDPFCGSGLELIERALLGGVRSVYGTDLSAQALAIAQENFAAAAVKAVVAKFDRGDFRGIASRQEFRAGGVTLIITNPPLGMRVPVADLRQLIEDLLRVAAEVLKPGGRLVFVNPLAKALPHPFLKLEFQQTVDMGGFECRVEKYLRVAE